MCNQDISRSYATKYLGVMIDDKLNWKDRVSFVHGKLSSSCGIIYKIKHSLTNEVFRTLYYSLFYPYLQYCNVVWGMANQTVINPLTLLQE